jgi:hypothetical protein
VKELTPEFFCLPEFLQNVGGLPITKTAAGRSIANVAVGAGSRNARDFVRRMRRTLESEAVTRGLPSWIDLLRLQIPRGRRRRREERLPPALLRRRGGRRRILLAL